MCCSKGLLKRIAPFFITLAVGLFVASFFVTVALPNIRSTRNWRRHQDYHRMMEFENQRLREDNLRLSEDNLRLKNVQENFQNKNITGKMDVDEDGNFKFEGSINDLVPPPPPMPMKQIRVRR